MIGQLRDKDAEGCGRFTLDTFHLYSSWVLPVPRWFLVIGKTLSNLLCFISMTVTGQESRTISTTEPSCVVKSVSVQGGGHIEPIPFPHAHFTHSTFLQCKCWKCVWGSVKSLRGGGGVLTDHINEKDCLLHGVGWGVRACVRACVMQYILFRGGDKYRM